MNTETIRVLLIANNSDHARFIREILAKAGPGVDLTCMDVVSGLETIGQIKYDCVLLDVSLADSLGKASLPNVPIVLLSPAERLKRAVEISQENEWVILVREHCPDSLLMQTIHQAIQRKQAQQDAGDKHHHHDCQCTIG